MGKFQLRSKAVFCTWSQSKLTKDDVTNFIKGKDPLYAIIAKEEHHEDGYHFHSLIKFKSTLSIRDCTYFDIKGEHPNFSASRNHAASINYCKKDGDWWELGDASTVRDGSLGLGVGDGESFFDYFERQLKEGTYL